MVVAPDQSMRVISWNILHGQVIPPNSQTTQLTSLKTATNQVVANYQPDFICLQEVDFWQPRSDFINQTKVIAQTAGLNYWAFLPAIYGTPGEKWKKVKDLENSIITEENENSVNKPSYGVGIATNKPITKLFTKELGKSWIGLPLMIPSESGKGGRFIYVKDEPRVALIVQLESGITIATTHLSFVPGVNINQLNRLGKYLDKLPGIKIIAGDLNLPANIPSKVSRFGSLAQTYTYPSWKEKIQFDYIMANRKSLEKNIVAAELIKNSVRPIISDHIPIGVNLKFQQEL
jgi:endonuclease/exonuclease/phosphatase family metal-dependent hydrolase